MRLAITYTLDGGQKRHSGVIVAAEASPQAVMAAIDQYIALRRVQLISFRPKGLKTPPMPLCA